MGGALTASGVVLQLLAGAGFGAHKNGHFGPVKFQCGLGRVRRVLRREGGWPGRLCPARYCAPPPLDSGVRRVVPHMPIGGAAVTLLSCNTVLHPPSW